MKNSKEFKVLLAEDDPSVSKLLQDFLDLMKVNYVSGKDKQQISKLITENYIDLAILDYDLPDINGVEIAKRLKKECPGCFIIMMTGWYFQLSEKEKENIDKLFPKPFQLQELRRVINENRTKKS